MASPDAFLAYILPVIAKEGGYSNHAADAGGETMYGITIARARAAGFTGPMRTLTKDQAVEIYRTFYWTQPMFDCIHAVTPSIGLMLLDLGINFGQGVAGRMLQRALNVLNIGGTLYPDLTVDGVCGAMTVAALRSFGAKRGVEGFRVLLGMIRAQASVRYIEIAEAKPSQEVFVYGWQLNRAIGTGP